MRNKLLLSNSSEAQKSRAARKGGALRNVCAKKALEGVAYDLNASEASFDSTPHFLGGVARVVNEAEVVPGCASLEHCRECDLLYTPFCLIFELKK